MDDDKTGLYLVGGICVIVWLIVAAIALVCGAPLGEAALIGIISVMGLALIGAVLGQ